MEKESLVMKYIAAWNWHILAIIFLVSSIIVVFSGENLGNNVMFMVFLLMAIIGEVIALRRRSDLIISQHMEVDNEVV